MTGIICEPMETMTYTPNDMTELVRGTDQDLLQWLMPIVGERSVLLNLQRVKRIDAAGIAALITLYGRALESGRSFSVINATARVREILALVGLDRILLSQNAVRTSHSEACFEEPAA